MITKKDKKEIETILLQRQEEKINNFEDKIAKLKAIFQVNNYGNEKLMLDKIKSIIYEI